MSKRIIGIVGIIVIIILLAGGGYFAYRVFFGGSGTITVWTLPGNEEAIKKVAEIFNKKHPSYRVKIVPVPEQEYEFQSLYALATQKGTTQHPAPDVWILPNEWMSFHRNKLVSAPDGVLDQAIKGYQRKRPKDEPVPDWPKSGRTNTQIIQEDYAPIAANDLVADGKVWGIPLNMDTLALFYDRTKISPPPKTWTDIVNQTKQFTTKSGDTVTRSTIALGDNLSVAHNLDILSILMLQSSTQMVDEKSGVATFNISSTGATPPGTRAIDFYTSFARSNKETYTWNKSLGDSLQALKNGKTLMAIGYLNDLDAVGPILQTKIGVAPLPQTDSNKPMTYGRYLAATVTKQASEPKKAKAAWEFISYFANPDASELYSTTLRQVPARKDVAKRLTLGPQYTAYLDQVGIATNWQKREVSIADGALDEALNLILARNENPQVALDVASKGYTTFLQQPTGIETDPQIISLWQSTEDVTDYKGVIRAYVSKVKDLKRVALSSHSPDRFEWEMINAMAARLGPDLVLLKNDTIARFAPTLRAFPAGSFNQSDKRLTDLQAIDRFYVPAVRDDAVIDGKLYAMPANIETLMLAMNADLMKQLIFDKNREENAEFIQHQEKFTSGPPLWDDVKTMARLATKRNGSTLTQSFIALGKGSNVAHANDIYAILIKQYGGEISDPDRLVTGIQLPVSSSTPTIIGQQAKDFLQSFSDPGASHYTWNGSQPNSLDALAQGKVFTAFVYPRDVAYIRKLNPTINLHFVPLPQLNVSSDPQDIASYYSFAIPLGGKRPNDALGFIKSAVLDDLAEDFVSPIKDNRTTTVLDRNGRANPQAIQRNTAQSYYKGLFPNELDQALTELLDNKTNLTQSANKINASLKKKIIQ